MQCSHFSTSTGSSAAVEVTAPGQGDPGIESPRVHTFSCIFVCIAAAGLRVHYIQLLMVLFASTCAAELVADARHEPRGLGFESQTPHIFVIFPLPHAFTTPLSSAMHIVLLTCAMPVGPSSSRFGPCVFFNVVRFSNYQGFQKIAYF